MASRGLFSGWPLIGIFGAVILAASWVDFSTHDDAAQGFRSVARFTAATSLLLFGLAFAASSAARLWRNAATTWLLRNRRYIGFSFAVSHFVHGGAVAAIAIANPTWFHAATNTVIYVGGGLGYVVIAAMAATSFDRSAAWLGPKWWRRLHTYGGWYIWAIFAFNAVGLTVQDLGRWPIAAFTFGVLAVRIAGKRAARRGQVLSN